MRFCIQASRVSASRLSSTRCSTRRCTLKSNLYHRAPSIPIPSRLRASVQVYAITALYRTAISLINHLISDIEENGVRLRLTVVDTPGFGDFVNNDNRYMIHPTVYFCRSQCNVQLNELPPFSSWKPIVENIEARFDAYLEQENRVNRQKLVDNRVHACLYFIQPTGHASVFLPPSTAAYYVLTLTSLPHVV